MKKVKLSLVAVAVVLLSFVSRSVNVAAQDKVQVTFWHAMNAHNQEMITSLVEEFNQSQDSIEVIEQNQGDNNALHQSIMASGVSQTLPTMGQIIAANQAEYATNGLLLPLEGLLTEANNFPAALYDDIYAGFIPEGTFEGELYGMPFNKSVRVIYVNNTLLDEIGAEVPTTWEDIRQVGVMLEEQGYDIPALGVENSLNTELESMARSNGATWIAEDLSAVDMSSEKASEPLYFLQELINAGYARTAGEDGFMSTPFGNGASVFYYGSSAGLAYFLPVAQENGYAISAIEAPAFGDEKAAILFGNNISLFQGSSEEEQAAAVEFLAFLLQAENTARWAINSGYLPITRAGVETELYQNHLAENPILEAATNTLEYATSSPAYPGQSEVYSELEMGIENVLVTGADPAEMLASVEAIAKAALGLE
ncbi:extracellular solute-binding protein [Fundicoccus culcitae]|uniref:Extracellular solute-binding protein n=1 Tax=Fundicoccus culcitae TaxID=2969821 RepID=A0ABY5P4I8_9LACT|nr:extracellular solute-binding protein [Fundicoccus culcitae]UUX33653.1 extracellular solute-binding protein [Fundicoccus culcitae]